MVGMFAVICSGCDRLAETAGTSSCTAVQPVDGGAWAELVRNGVPKGVL